MALKQTHTYAILEVSASAYYEIRTALEKAGWNHAFEKDDSKEIIAMQGIALANRNIEFDIFGIIKAVAEEFDTTSKEIMGRRRTADIAFQRQVAMTLVHEFTEQSFPKVGDIFGRDHATIMHAEKIVRNRWDTEPKVRDKIEALRLAFKNGKFTKRP